MANEGLAFLLLYSAQARTNAHQHIPTIKGKKLSFVLRAYGIER